VSALLSLSELGGNPIPKVLYVGLAQAPRRLSLLSGPMRLLSVQVCLLCVPVRLLRVAMSLIGCPVGDVAPDNSNCNGKQS
jgi:hypothetical protein